MRTYERIMTLIIAATTLTGCDVVLAQEQTSDAQKKTNEIGAVHVITSNDLSPFTGSKIGRFAQGFQYQYQYLENPNLIQVKQGSSQLVIPNPEHNLNQHSLTYDFKQVFLTSKTLSQALQKAYTLRIPAAKESELSGVCGSMKSKIECIAVGGSRLGRVLSGVTLTATLSERTAVFQSTLVPEGSFSNHYGIAGEVKFDPSQMFLTGTDWKAATETVRKIKLSKIQDDALIKKYAVCTTPQEDDHPLASQSLQKKNGEKEWWKCVAELAGTKHNKGFIAAAFLPTIDFKRQTQFDFVQYSGLLSSQPLEPGLNTLTFTWDLRRAIAPPSSRADALDAVTEILKAKAGATGKDKDAEGQKVCITINGSIRNYITVGSQFTSESCYKLALDLKPNEAKYELACSTGDGGLNRGSIAVGHPGDGDVPLPNSCNW